MGNTIPKYIFFINIIFFYWWPAFCLGNPLCMGNYLCMGNPNPNYISFINDNKNAQQMVMDGPIYGGIANVREHSRWWDRGRSQKLANPPWVFKVRLRTFVNVRDPTLGFENGMVRM